MANFLHQNDLPSDVKFSGAIAIDTETTGLRLHRDRLCIVQISDGNGDAHLIQFAAGKYDCPNLKKILADKKTLKIFHFARFDLAVLKLFLQIDIENI